MKGNNRHSDKYKALSRKRCTFAKNSWYKERGTTLWEIMLKIEKHTFTRILFLVENGAEGEVDFLWLRLLSQLFATF